MDLNVGPVKISVSLGGIKDKLRKKKVTIFNSFGEDIYVKFNSKVKNKDNTINKGVWVKIESQQEEVFTFSQDIVGTTFREGWFQCSKGRHKFPICDKSNANSLDYQYNISKESLFEKDKLIRKWNEWILEKYVVQTKDTAEKIALDHKISLNILQQLNFKENWELVIPGEFLNVPPKMDKIFAGNNESWELYTVESGDTGTNIADKLKISFNEVANLNAGIDWNNLVAGSEIHVPRMKK